MNLGARSPKQMMLAGVLGVLALGAVVYTGVQVEETFGGGTSTPVPATAVTAPAVPQESAPAADPVAVAGKTARPMGTTSAALDPTLHMEAMLVSESVVYSGSGRNIFSPNSAPLVVIQKPIAPARPVAALLPGPPPPPPGPPPPPPIDLKFFGTETLANGKQQAFLLHDDSVYLAAAGDVVLRRYRVISIEAKTIRVEDMQNKNTQTLPLLAN
jgi:hypothetical protein